MGKKRRAIDSAEVKDPRCAALAGSSKMGIRFLRSHVSSARAHRCRTDGENGFRVVVCLFDKPRHVGIGRYILSAGIVILRTCICTRLESRASECRTSRTAGPNRLHLRPCQFTTWYQQKNPGTHSGPVTWGYLFVCVFGIRMRI